MAWLLPQLQPWRKTTIAIDGVDHAGKSSLGRFLAWQARMPLIETDFTLVKGEEQAVYELVQPTHDAVLLRTLVEHRHRLNRPVLVEGVFVLKQLEAIGVDPDLLIEMRAIGRETGTWESEFAAYRKAYPRTQSPDFVVTRPRHDA